MHVIYIIKFVPYVQFCSLRFALLLFPDVTATCTSWPSDLGGSILALHKGHKDPPKAQWREPNDQKTLASNKKKQPCVQPAWIHFCCKLVCLQSGGFCTTVSLDFNIANHNAVDQRRWYGGCFAGKFLSSVPVSPTSLLAQKEIPRSNYRLIHWVWWVGIFVDPDFFCYSLLS